MAEGVTIYANEDLIEEIDDTIWELKQEGEIDRDASRSEVLRSLMEAWVEGKSTSRQKVPKPVLN